MFGLAGRLFNNEDDVERGIKLANGCVYAYRAFPTGMMPERIDLAPCKDRAHCPWDEEYWMLERDKRNEWKEHLPKGFTTAKDPRYLLRPEAIESVFYAYRLTGRKEFQDAGWEMFTAIAKGTKTEYANAAVLDVTTSAEKPPQEDYMEVSVERSFSSFITIIFDILTVITRVSGLPRPSSISIFFSQRQTSSAWTTMC